jgi:hypothetical protein
MDRSVGDGPAQHEDGEGDNVQVGEVRNSL